jgi:hypothetical protein
VLNETMPAVQPKAKMIPALQMCQPIVLVTALIVLTRTTLGKAKRKNGLEVCQQRTIERH